MIAPDDERAERVRERQDGDYKPPVLAEPGSEPSAPTGSAEDRARDRIVSDYPLELDDPPTAG